MNKKTVYFNKYFDVILKDNYYEISPKTRDVLILPIVDKKKFLLIKVKRHLTKKNLYEFPAGGFDISKETPLQAAKREFEEETGIKLKKKNKLFKIGKFYQMPNRIKDKVFIYGVFISSNQVNLNFASEEIHSLFIKSYEQILHLVNTNYLCSAVPLAALYKYNLLNNKKLKLY